MMKEDIEFTKKPKVRILESYDSDDKFNKGDVVQLVNIDSPEMIVLDIKFEEGKAVKDVYNKNGGKILLGIHCGWFSNSYEWCENTFNSKDLVKLVDEEDDFSPEFEH